MALATVVAQLITTSTNPIINSPAGANFLIVKAQVLNTDATNHSISGYLAKAGGAPSASNQVIKAQVLSPGVPYITQLNGQGLVNGDQLFMTCTGSNKATLRLTYSAQ